MTDVVLGEKQHSLCITIGFQKGNVSNRYAIQVPHIKEDLETTHTIAVFFKLKKAYDTVWREEILLYSQYRVKGNVPIFVVNLSKNYLGKGGSLIQNALIKKAACQNMAY